MLDAHRGLASVQQTWRKFGARIVRVRSFHSERQRRSGFWSEGILVFVVFLVWLVRGLLSRRRCRRLRVQPVQTRKENNRGPGKAKRNYRRSIHRFSSFVLV